MNRYTVERRWKNASGAPGKYIDFQYTKGLKAARELCGGKLHLSRQLSIGAYGGRPVYFGETGNLVYRVTYCGRWY